MRKSLRFRVGSFALCVLGVAAFAGASRADTFVGGTLVVRLGYIPPVTLAANPSVVPGGPGGQTITEASLLFGPVNVDLPDSLFTGIPQVSDLRIAGLAQPASGVSGVFSLGGLGTTSNKAGIGPGGFANGYGGQAALSGSAAVCVFTCYAIQIAVPLSIVGQGGTLYTTGLFQPMTLVGGSGWTAGPASIVGINSEVQSNAAMTLTCVPVTCPATVLLTGAGNGSFVTHVTMTGATSTDMTLGGATLPASLRAVTLVAPVRIRALGDTIKMPLYGVQQLVFAVPEPGTVLLVGAAALGLLTLGRRRMQR